MKDTVILPVHDMHTIRCKELAGRIYDIVEEATAASNTSMRVEISNPFDMYDDFSSAIPPDTAVHRVFRRIEPVVQAKVRDCCPDMWTFIAYQNRVP